MIGTELTKLGQLVKNQELTLVHVRLSALEGVPAHKHAGQDVYFTIVAGSAQVILDGYEEHTVTPGSVLHFAGERSIAVESKEGCEFFAYLINRR